MRNISFDDFKDRVMSFRRRQNNTAMTILTIVGIIAILTLCFAVFKLLWCRKSYETCDCCDELDENGCCYTDDIDFEGENSQA